ncbi:siderophore-interacting protein [Frondihabitans sucicola]|uniref:siderophore-interacting protein n=1 Tax=Frondihabitans sucicola TaxID=1268041 RepID=UPI0025724802|nr:siderophore-interacting protein [Frondihabitans sucicola]
MTTLSPHFTRVTFSGDELAHFGDTGFDQRIKVVLPHAEHGYSRFPSDTDWWTAWRALGNEERNVFRTYTARAIRPAEREVDVDFVAHGDTGPASAWVSKARVGDEMVLVGPDVRGAALGGGIEWNPAGASTVLLAGDETAVPAISAILAQLEPDAAGCVFLEVASDDDILTLEAPEGIDVHWLPRASQAATYGAPLVAAVRDWTARFVTAKHHGAALDPASLADVDIDHDILWEVPEGGRLTGDFYAWLAGEAGAIKTLRRFLVSEIGIDRQQVAFMGYWRLGRAEN